VAGTDDHIELSTRAETPLPGDDITVVPGPPPGRPRRLLLVIAVVAVVVVAGGITAAVALSSSDGSTRVRTNAAADVTPATLAPPATDAPRTGSIPPTTAGRPPTTAAASQPTTARVVVPPAGAPVTTAETPITEVPSSPLSALAWRATPASLTISTGKTATVTVTAHNASLGVVALPHPLSCAPRLQHDEMCEQSVQRIPPGGSASAQYTIDATGVASGSYTLNVEGVFTINVTVTK
jgi:hypothetical protein